MRIILFAFWFTTFFLGHSQSVFSNGGADNFHSVKALDGDGVIKLLTRYNLFEESCNVEKFYELNNLQKGDNLIKGRNYFLPVIIYQFNGKSIRSTIGEDNWDKAVRISKFNKQLLKSGLRKSTYKASNILWVPFHELGCSSKILSNPKSNVAVSEKPKLKAGYSIAPIFGSKHEKVKHKTDQLKDKVYYIVSGHGGPDPGSMTEVANQALCEDEYAYDVSLRLSKILMEQGATVHIIVQDADDGIRDEELLVCEYDEIYETGKEIPRKQLDRLKLRADIINDFHKDHLDEGKSDQTVVCIHVDSRSPKKRQDVFFYYYQESKSSMRLAYNMQRTFEEKYKKYRSNGEYHGTVTTRPLYMLKKTDPKAVYVELANIQNPADRRRLLPASNRQALAKWLYEGLIRE